VRPAAPRVAGGNSGKKRGEGERGQIESVISNPEDVGGLNTRGRILETPTRSDGEARRVAEAESPMEDVPGG